jgi:anti-sigma regulatory factor (Ser/Thr protein kinase)
MARQKMKLVLKNDLSSITKLHEAVSEFGMEHKLSEETVYDVRLVLEEAVVNTIRYGFDDKRLHDITVRLAKDGEQLVFEVTDDGLPFNPLDYPAPDIDKPLEERKEGGLGIYLIRNIMDDVAYGRVEGKNRLTLRKNLH